MSEITSFAPGSGRRVRPRSRLASDAVEYDLSGTWRFAFSPRPELAPQGAEQIGFDDSGWDTITVPSHWVLQGREDWGSPIYTNINYPFPVEPPFVPDDNPTGDYRIDFDLPSDFGERVFLRFDGVESLAIVHLNGVQVGIVRGSRLAQELDVTDEAVTGRNVLHVRVHQWSAATYVEDQDQWWLPGIFREVTVVSRPADGIDDIWLRADYDAATGTGWLLPEIRAGRSAYPVTVRVPELGRRQHLRLLILIQPTHESGRADKGHRPEQVPGQGVIARDLVELVGLNQCCAVFQPVQNAGFHRRIDLAKGHRRGIGAHGVDGLDIGVGRDGADLQALQVIGAGDRGLGGDVAIAPAVQPGHHLDPASRRPSAS